MVAAVKALRAGLEPAALPALCTMRAALAWLPRVGIVKNSAETIGMTETETAPIRDHRDTANEEPRPELLPIAPVTWPTRRARAPRPPWRLRQGMHLGL